MRPILLIAALLLLALPAKTGEPDFLHELEAALADAPTPTPPTLGVQTQPTATASDRAAATSLRAAPKIDESDPQTQTSSLFPELRVRVTARRHTILSSQSTGRIEEITVEDGNRFNEGATLVRMDAAALHLQRARAEAGVARQEVLYRMARELADMQSKGEAEVEVARMELEQARAELRVVDLLLSRADVAAPFPGRVADVFVREKQYVAEGTPLLEILDDSTLELEFIVPSVWVRWFHPGFQFEVTIEETGKTYEAVLERLGGKVDPLSQSVKAYASLLDLGPDLMEGMSGSARLAPPSGADD